MFAPMRVSPVPADDSPRSAAAIRGRAQREGRNGHGDEPGASGTLDAGGARLVGLQRADVHSVLRGGPGRDRCRCRDPVARHRLRRRLRAAAGVPPGCHSDRPGCHRGPAGHRPRARAGRVPGRRGLGGPAALRSGFVRRDHGVQLGSVRRRPGCRGQEPEPAGPAGRAHQPAGLGAAGPMRERRDVRRTRSAAAAPARRGAGRDRLERGRPAGASRRAGRPAPPSPSPMCPTR